MSRGPFGLPRPFTDSTPVVRAVTDDRFNSTDEIDTAYSAVLFEVEDEIGFNKTDSIMIGSNKDEGWDRQRGMIHFGYKLSPLSLEEACVLNRAIEEHIDPEHTFIECM